MSPKACEGIDCFVTPLPLPSIMQPAGDQNDIMSRIGKGRPLDSKTCKLKSDPRIKSRMPANISARALPLEVKKRRIVSMLYIVAKKKRIAAIVSFLFSLKVWFL
jgi:hypothetical protein